MGGRLTLFILIVMLLNGMVWSSCSLLANVQINPASTATPLPEVASNPTPTSLSLASETVTSEMTPTSVVTLLPAGRATVGLEAELPSESITTTATATLIPFPVVTYIYPERKDRDSLLVIEHQPSAGGLSKDKALPWWRRLLRLWPLSILMLVWLGLAVWFIWVNYQISKSHLDSQGK